MDSIGNDKIVINPVVKAGEFVCDTPDNIYFGMKHIERWIETAQDNGQVLKVVAYFIPKI